MRYIQRALSDVFNLFIHDADDPERLWPWGELLLYGGFLALMFVTLAKLGC